MEESYFYRGKLPHLQPPGATYFITFRLFGSIPLDLIQNLKEQYREAVKKAESALFHRVGLPYEFRILQSLPKENRLQLLNSMKKRRYIEQLRYFGKIDEFLDSNLNEPHWLKSPKIAKIVEGALHFYHGKYYDLWAFCIMSNHVHVLLSHYENSPPLWNILQKIKRYTAVKANRILGRKNAAFWEKESYDHLVREGEFDRILAYILENPVKARIVKEWNEYPWTYCHPDLMK